MKTEDENEFGRCPYCKDEVDAFGHQKGTLMILQDWVSMHDKETLLHCWDCERAYKVYYKLDRVVELMEKDIEGWDVDEE